MLRYERALIEAEAGAMRLLRKTTDFPVPTVVALDHSREEMDGDYLLAEWVPGQRLDLAKRGAPQEFQDRAERDLGRRVRSLHDVRGQAFGTFNGPVHATWPEAFCRMLEDLRRDGLDAGVELPSGAFECAEPHLGALAETTVPSLVHWDLWDKNVLVSPEDGRVTGVVDFERAMWADPLMEARFLVPTAAFCEGYGSDPLEEPDARARRALYDLYLALVGTIECAFRGFGGEHERGIRAFLDQAMSRLIAR